MSKASVLVLALAFVVGLLHLGVHLHKIQVETAADYNYASVRQSVRRVRTGGMRGCILDRRGTVLADNRPSLSLVCHPAAFQRRTWEATAREMRASIDALTAVIGRAAPLTDGRIRSHVNRLLPLPLEVWRDLGVEELARFCEHEREFPGFSVQETAERT